MAIAPASMTARQRKLLTAAVILSAIAGLFYFGSVLTGRIEATGAAPGGLLSGRWAVLFSLDAHALAGALTAWLLAFGWSVYVGAPLGLLAAVRRRQRWFWPLVWIVAFVVSQAAVPVLAGVMDWLGSASPGQWDGARTWYPPYWDAAAYWGATVFIIALLVLTAPVYIAGLWRWSNGGRLGSGQVWFQVPLFSIALASGLLPFAITWAVFSGVLSAFGR